ncbi:MAG TPA: pilus assembly protein TadG-related protein [Azospirillum sp.]|nr:pilus assembly protein TadG-related protein [Azospirillum sp.]
MRNGDGGFRARLGALATDRRGTVAITLAMALPILVGMAALGIEVGVWYHSKRTLQAVADAAAVAAAIESGRGDKRLITDAATADAAENGFVVSPPTTTLTVNFPPLTGPNAGDNAAVEVVATRRHSPLLSALFLKEAPTVSARSVARRNVDAACVLALNPTASASVAFVGLSIVDLPDCTIATNSSSRSSIEFLGLSFLTADSIWTVGKVLDIGLNFLRLKHGIKTETEPFADPYAHFDTMPPPVCDYPNGYKDAGLGPVVLTPAVYCGKGIDIDGIGRDVRMNPGVYYIVDSDFTIGGLGNRLTGDGVTIVLTTRSSPSRIGGIKFVGASSVRLRAPTGPSATFPGMVVVQDGRAPAGTGFELALLASINIEGALYLPRQKAIWVGGNAVVSSGCTQIVADRVQFIGVSVLQFSGCPAMGVKTVGIGGAARLVE